jgi:tRNA(fMet)-specific endonuclease VapC
MLEYMLDTNICIYVIKNRPAAFRERFEQLAKALRIYTVTLGELLYGVGKSARRNQNLQAVEQFTARLEVLPFRRKPQRISARYRPSWSGLASPAARPAGHTTCSLRPMRAAKA